ncbi:hypothetical protein [Sinorhizobium medicae]|uniref:hypothetical protein n=1 Tax=Sinorhizobium medicae TaxID=110321 RepID=UPI0003AA72A8|nr:hypothetical protein [Sinorhizobium medicae]
MLRLSFKIIAGEQASNDGATCSLDLRQRVADALAAGMTVRAAALRFGISAATAVRIGQRERSGRGLAPAKMGGHVKPMLRGAAADEVHRRLAAKPDWMVRALAADLGSEHQRNR